MSPVVGIGISLNSHQRARASLRDDQVFVFVFMFVFVFVNCHHHRHHHHHHHHPRNSVSWPFEVDAVSLTEVQCLSSLPFNLSFIVQIVIVIISFMIYT